MYLLQMETACVLVEERVVAAVFVVQYLVKQEAVFLAFAEEEVYTGIGKRKLVRVQWTSLG